MPTPILIIHGDETHVSREEFIKDLRTKEIHLDRMRPRSDWKVSLQKDLGQEFDVFMPRMPLRFSAEYDLWKLWFKRVCDAVDAPCILVGHSLGAMFLLKYFSENTLKHATPALLLVAPYFTHEDYPETEQSTFTLDTVLIQDEKVKKTVFFHSKDDPVVPFESFKLFKKYYSNAEFKVFLDKGHFLTSDFPEIVEEIRSLS